MPEPFAPIQYPWTLAIRAPDRWYASIVPTAEGFGVWAYVWKNSRQARLYAHSYNMRSRDGSVARAVPMPWVGRGA